MLNELGVIYPYLKRRQICKKGVFNDFWGYFDIKITPFYAKKILGFAFVREDSYVKWIGGHIP